jgi:hypothetical protein
VFSEINAHVPFSDPAPTFAFPNCLSLRLALDVAVQRPRHADPSMHQRPSYWIRPMSFERRPARRGKYG